MNGLKDYIQNEALVNIEDLIELGNSYKKIAESQKRLKIPLDKEFLYNMDAITREINRRVK
jgi:hypothetical protein